MAEAARKLGYEYGYYGSTAPAYEPYEEQDTGPIEIPVPQERSRAAERAGSAVRSAPAVSLFAVFGAVFAGILMVFVILAQINYNEIAGETVKLDTQFAELTEQERKLEIEFESVIDMKEIERYARDTLGMSRPDSGKSPSVQNVLSDRAEILGGGDEDGAQSGFGAFISSLFEYFK